jgi:hypothetical protein
VFCDQSAWQSDERTYWRAGRKGEVETDEEADTTGDGGLGGGNLGATGGSLGLWEHGRVSGKGSAWGTRVFDGRRRVAERRHSRVEVVMVAGDVINEY